MVQTLVCGVFAIAAFAIVSFFQLRNIWWALAVAIGPFPGLILSQFLHAFTLRDKIVIAAFCLVLFEIIGASVVEHRSEQPSKSQAWSDLHVRWGSFVVASMAGLIVFAFVRFFLNTRAVASGIVVTAALALGSSTLSFFIAARISGISENSIVSANRTRERGERLFERITPVAFPRWGSSFFGMGLVLAAMAFFGAHRAWVELITNRTLLVVLAATAVVLAATVARDWRRAMAVILVFAWIGVMEAWVATYSHAILRDDSLTIYVATLAVTLVPILAMYSQHSRLSLIEGVVNGAGAQAIATLGNSIFFSIVGVIAFLIP